jgi:uncharacterized protein YxjI
MTNTARNRPHQTIDLDPLAADRSRPALCGQRKSLTAAGDAGTGIEPAGRGIVTATVGQPLRRDSHLGGTAVLDRNRFVIKEQSKMFSSRSSYEILDETGKPLGNARPKVGALWSTLGLVLGKDRVPLTIEVRAAGSDAPVFAVRRRGLLFRKVEVVDGEGRVVGTYKAKWLSLAGGFHVYDQDGKHVADIKGKLLKSEYRILSPSGAEIGAVSRKWGGWGRELFTSNDTYGVEVSGPAAEDRKAKMVILGAALAIDAIFKAGGKGGGSKDDEGGEEKSDE